MKPMTNKLAVLSCREEKKMNEFEGKKQWSKMQIQDDFAKKMEFINKST
jgi:hypothetical protein